MMRKLKTMITYLTLMFLCIECQTSKTYEPPDVTELTVAEIHAAFKAGSLSCEELVATYIARINQFDTQINSITMINPNALARAKELDEEYQRTKVLRPLHGIPLIVKDNIHTNGMRTSAGSLALQNFVPEADAFIIAKLVEAGAIVLAKSNMAEWAFTPWGSFSSTNGATLNAYNGEYTSAGSSGGTGAAIAANFGVIGLGTDTGGSIRLPSSHGSLVGFRPTMGLVSRSGVIPCVPPCKQGFDTAGPMCRTVEDATRVLEIIAGIDGEDPMTRYSEGKTPDNYLQFLQADGLKEARIGVLREIIETEIDSEILALFEKAIEDMKLMGAVIVDSVKIPDFANLRKIEWCDDFKSAIEKYLTTYVKNDTLQTIQDIIRIGTKSQFTADELTFYAHQSDQPGHLDLECLDAYSDPKRVAFRNAIEDHMNLLQLDALIYPTWNIKPYRMAAIVEEYIGENTAAVAPPTGQPAFTVPMGFMSGNLPTGLEFLGRMFSEPTLIKLAYSYEQGTKHRVQPILKR